MSAINLTNLEGRLKDYYLKHKDGLHNETLLGQDLSNFEVWDDVKDEVALPTLEIGDLLQPGDSTTFAPKGGELVFKNRTLKVRNWKVDLRIIPDKLEKTWLGAKFAKGSRHYNMPFEQFIFDYIIERIHHDMRLNALYSGVYNAAGNSASDIVDGLLTKVAAEIVATNITPVVTGAITQANVVEKLLAVHDSLGEAYQMKNTQMIVNSTIFNWYVRNFNQTTNPSIVATNNASRAQGAHLNEFPLEGTNCILKREPGFGSSQRIICTPVSNIVYGTDSLSDVNNWDFEKEDRSVKIFIDGKIGTEFKEVHDRALAVNDQA